MPFWDQWAKEGELLYAPWFERGELWHNLFLPHSEHRMAPTLALNLGLVVAGGQWDARTQCVADAALDAAIAVGLFAPWEKLHFVTITWQGERDTAEVATLELSKSSSEALLALLRARATEACKPGSGHTCGRVF